MRPLTRPVLVGVTGEGENTDALRFAISEARTLGVGLLLVHAAGSQLPPPPPSILITESTWSEVGTLVVDAVRDELESLLEDEDLPVGTVVRHGEPRRVFAEMSEDASMVVLQHRDLSRLHRIVTGSTVAAVATRAHCPVVSVPPARREGSGAGVISVGVHADGGPSAVVETAFATAALHRSSLRLVHAWRLATAYDDLLGDADRWTAQHEATITAAAAELRAKYPDVAVHVHIRHDWPGDVLVSASQDSDLLVVGRHDGVPAKPARLGSLARALVAHADCPVMVVPL